jgi:hypothetical protein
MGVVKTHYIVVGVALTDHDAVQEFFQYSEAHYDEFNKLEDNAYQEEIISDCDGHTLICDGMNGEYIVYGEILTKHLENDGFDLNIITNVKQMMGKKQRELLSKKATELLKREFSESDVKCIVFTHWH